MANSQFGKPTANVRLRDRTEIFEGKKQARASKVTSMIEIFSQGDKDDVIGTRTKQPFRNQTFVQSKPKQEVIRRDCQKKDIVPIPRARKLSPSTVPIGLRVPKPYVTERANPRDKEVDSAFDKVSSPQLNSSNQRQGTETKDSNKLKLSAENKSASPNRRVGLEKEVIKPKPLARKKLSSEINFQNQNGDTNRTENGAVKSPQRIGKDIGKSNQEVLTGNGIQKPVPVGQNSTQNMAQNETPSIRETSERKSPRFSARSSTEKSSPNQADDRRISSARNYWEWKIDSKRDSSPKDLRPKKFDSSPSPQKPAPAPKRWVNANTGPSPSHNTTETKVAASSVPNRPGSPGVQRLNDPSTFFELSPTARRRLNSSPQSDATTNNRKFTVAERLKTFGQSTVVKSKPDSNDWVNGNVTTATQFSNDAKTSDIKKEVKFSPRVDNGPNAYSKVQKTVPERQRFMTSATGLQSNPPKLTSSLHGGPNAKNLTASVAKRPISPLARSPPPSPRAKIPEASQNDQNVASQPGFPRKAPPKLPEKPGYSPQHGQNNRPEKPQFPPQKVGSANENKINPLPKPARTFTFTLADVKSPPKLRPKHQALSRVSSDLPTVKGPGISGNLALLSEELRQSMPDVSTATEGYEEVAFCEVQDEKSATMQNTRNTQKWRRQHNYEEVDDPTFTNDHKALTANYDRIDLGKVPPPRPASLTDLSNTYSHLTFQQDLHFSQSKPPPAAPSTSSLEHLKLRKQNSDMSEVISRSSSFSKSDSGTTPRITDKIRDAFNQISRKYKHHRRSHDDNEDAKSNSSSGDEDSDTESDIVKHKQTLDRVRTFQKSYRSTLKYKSLERDLSRFEEVTIFEQVLICKIMKGPDGKFSSKVSYRFPAPPPGKTLGDEKTLAHFCFPDIDVVKPCEKMSSQSYSFMLTRENGTRKFGYCRRILPPGTEPRYPVVYCLISPLGSFGVYELILDELELRHRTSLKRVSVFLEALFVERFPAPGRSVTVNIDEQDGSSHFVLRRPFDTRLEHVDLQCLLTEVGVENAIKIFASLLLERRVILCGKSLSTLTACIHALRALLYPFVWQHVFVPVLPPPMVDLCCSPTPLLIGIMDTSIERLLTLPLEEAFIFNLVTGEIISSMGDEVDILPRKLQTPLIDTLESFTNEGRGSTSQPSYDFAIDYESAERNTVISEAFMHLFVEMIGHYQNHFQPVMQATNAQTKRFGRVQRNFNRVSFYDDVTSRSLRRFLDLFMGTQMFDGFIHSRELASADYEGLFERRISHHIRHADASQLNFKVIKTKMKKLMQGIGKKK